MTTDRLKKILPFLHKKAKELQRLYRLSREERDDMLQTGLLRLVKMAHRYDPARSKWITFAGIVTVNEMRSWLKRRNRHRRRFRAADSAFIEAVAAAKNDPQRAAEIAEARRILEDYLVRAGIAGAPEGEALRLYFAEGFSASETCRLTGIEPTDLKKRVESARKELRKPAA